MTDCDGTSPSVRRSIEDAIYSIDFDDAVDLATEMSSTLAGLLERSGQELIEAVSLSDLPPPIKTALADTLAGGSVDQSKESILEAFRLICSINERLLDVEKLLGHLYVAHRIDLDSVDVQDFDSLLDVHRRKHGF